MGRKKKVNKKFKDTVFRLLFGKDRNELLKLYNAVNGSNYRNADELEINTLEDAIFVNMKNDVSFVFQDYLNLYEHQSTPNPNLPLRDLFYAADLLQEMTDELNIYGGSILKIPTPHFIMFYNGTEDLTGITQYRLSDMYIKKEENPQLELVVSIININEGQNNTVLDGCDTLRQYSRFIAMIRKNYETMPAKEAVKKAVDDCIDQGILRDFLLKHKAQVIKMSIYEYDEKKQRRLDREDGRKEGQNTHIIILIRKKVLKGKSLDIIADELESTVDEIKPFYDAVIKYPQGMKPEDILARVEI
ncbi:MAG: hypothetical protein E7298_03040 [Lachnospiraceae bacterium]|nr:hypothetical protein [Lachnospiraceae bacterium]